MLRNYFKIAWRNMINNKVYSAINILGLATGMAVTMIIALWVHKQYSYNRFLPGYKNVYEVKLNHTVEGSVRTIASANLPLANVLRKEIPEIKYVAETDGNSQHSLMVGDKKLYLPGMRVGADFLKILQYPLQTGNVSTVFYDPYSIVLTASTAKALFGNEDPINKTVRYDNTNDLKVTGVLKDIPDNASLQFTYLMPFSYLEQTSDWVKVARTQWGYNLFRIYVALQPQATYAQVEPKIKDIIKKNSREMQGTEVMMQPAKDWQLYTQFENGKATGGFIEYVRLFSIIGVLVLIIACINFTNLSTARSEKRAREVGVRKAIGSQRSDLIVQFLTESLLVSCMAFFISLLIVQCSLPFFNELTQSTLRVPYSSLACWSIMAGFIVLTALLAGSKPAFYLSSFEPVKVLKGSLQIGAKASWPRKALVVIQFSCSIALIISTIIVYQQLQHVKSRPVGYDAGRLLMTDMSSDLNRNYMALKNELLQTGYIESVAYSSSPVTAIYDHSIINEWPGKTGTDLIHIGCVGLSDNYFRTLGMKLLSGRDFTTNRKTDSATIIVNEAAVKKMQLKEPLGQEIMWNGSEKARIVGVVKDALMESPYASVVPPIFTHRREGRSVLYRLRPEVNTQTALTKLAPVFNKYNPAYPYSYQFADTAYNDKFKQEVLVGRLAAIFATLAIFISCLGLFALAAYMVEQRTKEIGVRKVLGASVSQLWLLLSKDFIALVLVSCIIASPVALYFLQNWLQKYEYRISPGIPVFVISAAIAIVITVITISFQTIKAAIQKPIVALKSE
jgi:putative ABC transport system permease protein